MTKLIRDLRNKINKVVVDNDNDSKQLHVPGTVLIIFYSAQKSCELDINVFLN